MKKGILREIFSGANGKLSAKRVVGGVAMSVALGCTIALVIRDGSNTVVENLLMTIFITSVSLLGLPAITSVWGNSKLNVNSNDTKSDENESLPATSIPTDPAPTQNNSQPIMEHPDCENCIYKRKRKGTE